MTMTGLLFDLEKRQVHYINAGHNSVLYCASGKTKSILRGGTPLGFRDNPQFGATSLEIEESLVFFSIAMD